MEPLDRELSRPLQVSLETRARLLASLRPELSSAPSKNRWRFELAGVMGSVFLLAAAIGAALLWSGNTSVAVIGARAGVLAMCGLLCAFAAALALVPGLRKAQLAALLAFVPAAAALVLVRTQLGPSSAPEWVCTATHLSVALVPLLVGVFALRRTASRVLAGMALGVAAGATGAIVGELACGRDATHVLLFHVTAWGAVVAAGAALSVLIRPRSHAP